MNSDGRRFHRTEIARDCVNAVVGQQVLVVEQQKKKLLDVALVLEERLTLGVIVGPVIVRRNDDIFKNGIFIPVKGFVQKGRIDKYYGRDDWVLHKGPIVLNDITMSGVGFLWFENTLYNQDGTNEKDHKSLRILAGNVPVEQYFRYKHDMLSATFWQNYERRSLGLLTPTEFDEFAARCPHIDVSYAKALTLLSLTPPENLRVALAEEQDRLRVTTMQEIASLTGQIGALEQRIRAAHQSVGKSVLVRTKVDAFFATYGESNELCSLKPQLKRHLASAVELGMHREPRTYQIGSLTVDGAKTVQRLCEQYGIS